eukprot:14890024-Alexandrium_andersonii.AAC.1
MVADWRSSARSSHLPCPLGVAVPWRQPPATPPAQSSTPRSAGGSGCSTCAAASRMGPPRSADPMTRCPHASTTK